MLVRYLSLVCLGFVLSGCCWFAKRSCFPECPKPLPAKVVTVEKPCELPPKLLLPRVSQTNEGCAADQVCFTADQGALIAAREALLKGWISEVRSRCGPAAP